MSVVRTGSGARDGLSRLRTAIGWRFRTVQSKAQREFRRLQRPFVPVDPNQIRASLSQFELPRSGIVFVHSSLSACGNILGGAAAVVGAVSEWVRKGTLVLPTHTYCYPQSDGSAPLFIATQTPSKVGAISDYFWRLPNVLRSLHPSHSLAAAGPGAKFLTEGHERFDTPCGAGTPYERLVLNDAAVLMFGARMDAYTLFHTTEDAAKVPYLYEPTMYELRASVDGSDVQIIRMWRQDNAVPRCFASRDAWLEAQELLTRSTCGRGELLYIRSALAVHNALMRQLRIDPFFLASASRVQG